MTVNYDGVIFHGDGDSKHVSGNITGEKGRDGGNVARALFLDGVDATLIVENHPTGMLVDIEGIRSGSIAFTLDGVSYLPDGKLISEGQQLSASIPEKGHINATWSPRFSQE